VVRLPVGTIKLRQKRRLSRGKQNPERKPLRSVESSDIPSSRRL
jgi:hypothetical protein